MEVKKINIRINETNTCFLKKNYEQDWQNLIQTEKREIRHKLIKLVMKKETLQYIPMKF